ncbi:unnamed protein product [Acanthosepion pharaonis]|uniref:Uncharacterized protein n=1 Tax=Acanthosepion pharaonis TaxID=158019 RepID=A0A812ENJ1_ACAPH|nr:unnamed protein product [Sepia pharaonis]
MKRKNILSLSLSLSLFYNVHSFSLFFLPSYPSIHFLPYYLRKPFYQTIFFLKEKEKSQFSFYLHEKEKISKRLSLSLSLSLFITSIPSLSSFSFLPFNTFPPYYLLETFLSEKIQKERKKRKRLSFRNSFLSTLPSLSLFSPSIPSPFQKFPLIKPFYRTIFFSLSEKYPPSLSLSLSLSFITSIPSLFFLLPTLQYIPSLLSHETFLSDESSQSDSLSIYMKRKIKKKERKTERKSISFSLLSPSLSFLPMISIGRLSSSFYLHEKYPFSLSLSLSLFHNILFLFKKKISTLSLSLSLFLFQRPFLLSLLSPSYPSIHSLPYYLLETFLSVDLFSSQSDSLSIYIKQNKNIHPLSLSLSLSFLLNVHSFSLFFLLPTLQYISSPYYLMKPFYRTIFFSSQFSFYLHEKRKISTLSLSLSLSLSLFPFLLLSFFLPSYPSIHFPPLLSHETFLSVDLFSSQSDSLSIYMKRKNIHSLSLSLSLSLFITSIPSLFFLLPTLQYIPSLLSHETFLSDDLFLALNSLSIFMKKEKISTLSLSLSLSLFSKRPFLLSLLSPFPSTLQYIPSLLSHETFLSDDLF